MGNQSSTSELLFTPIEFVEMNNPIDTLMLSSIEDNPKIIKSLFKEEFSSSVIEDKISI